MRVADAPKTPLPTETRRVPTRDPRSARAWCEPQEDACGVSTGSSRSLMTCTEVFACRVRRDPAPSNRIPQVRP